MRKLPLLAAAPLAAAISLLAGTSAAQGADVLRLRIGFSLDGGLGDLSAGPIGVAGPAVGGDFRIGVQANHLLGVYYQQSPQLSFLSAGPGQGGVVIVSDYNSAMVSAIFGHIFEVAAGPSFDLVTCSFCLGQAAEGFGIAGRAALMLGGRREIGVRRRAFTIGIDDHESFISGLTMISLTGSVGMEWY